MIFWLYIWDYLIAVPMLVHAGICLPIPWSWMMLLLFMEKVASFMLVRLAFSSPIIRLVWFGKVWRNWFPMNGCITCWLMYSSSYYSSYCSGLFPAFNISIIVCPICLCKVTEVSCWSRFNIAHNFGVRCHSGGENGTNRISWLFFRHFCLYTPISP